MVPDPHDNPFAITLQPTRPRNEQFRRAVVFFLIVGGLTAAGLVLTMQGKRWLINTLAADLDSLSPSLQQERLMQLASFGVDTLPQLVPRLFSADDSVSETAYSLLRSQQDQWLTLSVDHQTENHSRLIGSIDSVIRSLSVGVGQRAVARASDLVHRTIAEFAEPSAEQTIPNGDSIVLVAQATLSQLQSLSIQPNVEAEILARSVAVKKVTPTLEAGWTDWPPPAVSQRRDEGRTLPTTHPDEGRGELGSASEQQARVLRSGPTSVGTRLQSLPQGMTVPLSLAPAESHTVDAIAKPAVVSSLHIPSRVLPVTAVLTDSPMTAMANETVMHHLANSDRVVAAQAENELRSRGLTDEQVQLATRLAVAEPSDRISLIDDWLRQTPSDPTPWLAMLLDDPHRGVRLHVVSQLATINQPQTRAMLQDRLHRENDPQVAIRIRKVLDLR